MSEDRPTENRGGAAPTDDEVREKGSWAEQAQEGVVPGDLGGSDAPPEIQPDDPELGSQVQGRRAVSDEPATRTGIDPTGGDQADAVTDGGPDVPEGVEPDLKDATSGPRQVDADSAV
jgi:hypothetical protein